MIARSGLDRTLPAGIALAASLLLTCIGCNPGTPGLPEEYFKEISEWRQARHTRITSADGWLTLVALGWVQEGDNTCGADSLARVVLPPGSAPKTLGTFRLEQGEVTFAAATGVRVESDSIPVTTTIALRDDHHEAGPTVLRHNTISMYVIRRGTKLGIRVKDSQSPARLNFGGLRWYDVDPAWRIVGHYEAFDRPHEVEIPDMTGGTQSFVFPGSLVFTLGDRLMRLDVAFEEGAEESFFIMFTDETSGEETYGAGRQLYTDLPDEHGQVIIDFNKAFNWPCVFTEFATCPIPPKQNRLPVRVEAGEMLPKNY